MSVGKYWPLGLGIVASAFVMNRCSNDIDKFEAKVNECATKGAAYLVVHGYGRNGQPTAAEARAQAETRCRTKGLDSFNNL